MNVISVNQFSLDKLDKNVFLRFGCVGILLLLLGWTQQLYAAPPKGYILHIELSPAVCKIDPLQKRTRQCLEGYSLTVLGLFPEGVEINNCETSSSATLSPVQRRVVMRLIPDEAAQARLWRSVGGCVSMNASQYFRKLVTYAEQLKVPPEVTSLTTIKVSRSKLENRFYQMNSGLNQSSLKLTCAGSGRAAVLTDVKICYRTNGQYQACHIQHTTNCPSNMLIQGSY